MLNCGANCRCVRRGIWMTDICEKFRNKSSVTAFLITILFHLSSIVRYFKSVASYLNIILDAWFSFSYKNISREPNGTSSFFFLLQRVRPTRRERETIEVRNWFHGVAVRLLFFFFLFIVCLECYRTQIHIGKKTDLNPSFIREEKMQSIMVQGYFSGEIIKLINAFRP